MSTIFKMIGGLLLTALLMGHFLAISLFLAPVPKLLGLLVENREGFLVAEDIPEVVESFLTDNKIELVNKYEPGSDSKKRLMASILDLRRDRFMSASEQLSFDMNLLDFGEGIIGLKAASEYYFKKPIAQLADKDWITLIHLQKMFSS